MPDQIRYDEEAITEIFRQAAEAQTEAQNKAGSAGGLTLEELQEIGAEAGLSPEFVARAATNMAREIQEPPLPTFMGLDIGVRRSVALPGPMSDEEWALLVADLRQTFGARGKIQQAGELREWYNGNLFAHVQPDGDGYRLNMGSTKGMARELMMSGMTMVAMSLVTMLLLVTFKGESWASALPILTIALAGLGVGGFGYLQLPNWRSTRESQMEAIGRRAVERSDETRQRVQAEAAVAEVAPAAPASDLDLADAEGFEAPADERIRPRERS